MRFGANIFLTDLTVGPAELARELEDRGFSSLWVPEHTHIPTSRRTPAPMGEPLAEEYKRCLDPFVALTMAAAVTTDLVVGTGVALLAEREPIVTAKVAASLDVCSGGRLRLGVGYGWNIEELEDHGVSKRDRRDVVRERVLAMQALWSDDEASFSGAHVSFPPSWAWPKPVQVVGGRTGVPVFVGGAAGPRLFEHIAGYATGWLPHGGAGVAAALPMLRAAFERVDRDPAELQIVPFGTVPTAEKVDYFARLGITEMVVQLPSADRDGVWRRLDELSVLL